MCVCVPSTASPSNSQNSAETPDNTVYARNDGQAVAQLLEYWNDMTKINIIVVYHSQGIGYRFVGI